MADLPDRTDLVEHLEEQERRLVLPGFDLDDAYALGRYLADRAQDEGLSVLVDVRRGDFVLFRAAFGVVTLDQQVWAARKAAVVQRMEASSALVAARMDAAGIDPVAMGWLDHGYAVTGGSFPVRVSGVGVVAAVTASGLTSEEDHELSAAGVQWLLSTRGREPGPGRPGR